MADPVVSDAVKRWTEWVELLSKLAALIGGTIAAFWAYTKFVLEKGLLPPVEFDIGCAPAAPLGKRRVIELALKLKNVGSSTLICSNLRVDVRYLQTGDEVAIASDPQTPVFANLLFPRSLLKDDLNLKNPIESPAKIHGKYRPWLKRLIRCIVIIAELGRRFGRWLRSLFYQVRPNPAQTRQKSRGFPVVRYDTFVQPGVAQVYTVVTVLPDTATFVLIWASFHYGVRPSLLQRAILRAGRVMGLIQYSLTHVDEPHTAQRVFDLRPTQTIAPR